MHPRAPTGRHKIAQGKPEASETSSGAALGIVTPARSQSPEGASQYWTPDQPTIRRYHRPFGSVVMPLQGDVPLRGDADPGRRPCSRCSHGLPPGYLVRPLRGVRVEPAPGREIGTRERPSGQVNAHPRAPTGRHRTAVGQAQSDRNELRCRPGDQFNSSSRYSSLKRRRIPTGCSCCGGSLSRMFQVARLFVDEKSMAQLIRAT